MVEAMAMVTVEAAAAAMVAMVAMVANPQWRRCLRCCS